MATTASGKLDPSLLQAAIAALEAQRATLGEAVVDAGLAALRAQLASVPPQEPAPEQQLKLVSILFLDVVGSTQLAQQLDPEEVSAVMDGALARGTTIVQAHHGKVLQYAGDNLLAVFGADAAQEDDAERAVRCGLALLALGRTLRAEVLSAHGHPGFDVRVGIHCGHVLLGGGVDADGSIRGQAVNVAARMEQAAPAGGLRISDDCFAQVRGLFDVETQEPLLIKGVAEPMRSHLVLRARARPFRGVTRGIEGLSTPMMGRAAELAQLQSAFEAWLAAPSFHFITVVADAGLGKSRLLAEFDATLAAGTSSTLRWVSMHGQCTPHTQGQPFGLLRDILAGHLQVADDDSLADAQARFEAGIVPLFAPEAAGDTARAHAHLLGHLIGIDYRASPHLRGILHDPRQIHSRGLHAAVQVFTRIAARGAGAILLQLEDLQWADNESLDFLEHLSRTSAGLPLLLLATARSSLFERRGNWAGKDGMHSRISLAPLGEEASQGLAAHLLRQLPDVPATLSALLLGHAAGNPFYMEELLKMLIDAGAIQVTAAAGKAGASGTWHVNAERLLLTQVPTTLTGVLQARLDALPALERMTLQAASVIGQVFWDQPLVALDPANEAMLPALVRRELALLRHPAKDAEQAEGLVEYSFKHAILHRVTYATVLRRRRRELHGQLAHWLSQLSGSRAHQFLGATAEHYERAGDALNAAEFHARAAEHSLTRLATESVLTHVGRGLALLDPSGEPADADGDGPRLRAAPASAALRWRLFKARESVLDLQGRRPEQRADLDAMEQLADQLDDDRLRAETADRRALLAMRTGAWSELETTGRLAAVLAQRAGEDELHLRSLRHVAHALAFIGDWQAGQALAQQVLEQARVLGLLRVQSFCLNTLGAIAQRRSDDLAALRFAEESLSVHAALMDRRSEAALLYNTGTTWLGLGALEAARERLNRSLELARANGDRALECAPLMALGLAALWDGDAAGAIELTGESRMHAAAAGLGGWEAMAGLYLGHAQLAAGLALQAEGSFEAALALAQAPSDTWRHDAMAGLARAALALGQTQVALQRVLELQAVLDAGDDLDDVLMPRRLELTCHQVLLGFGDARAGFWLERAHTRLMAKIEPIGDAALREGMMTRVAEHREILQAWAARGH